MKKLRIPLKAVLYKENSHWIAHCLEFDLLGDGDTPEKAVRHLGEAIFTQVEASVKYGCLDNLFTPAEGRYFEMFAAGQNKAYGEVTLSFKEKTFASVTIENIETREYTEEVDSGAGLVLT